MLEDLDHFGKNYREEEERQKQRKPWMLTWPQVKLVALAGVGFFLDAYDLSVLDFYPRSLFFGFLTCFFLLLSRQLHHQSFVDSIHDGRHSL